LRSVIMHVTWVQLFPDCTP